MYARDRGSATGMEDSLNHCFYFGFFYYVYLGFVFRLFDLIHINTIIKCNSNSIDICIFIKGQSN